MRKICGPHRKTFAVQTAVAYQYASGIIRHVHPFVKIECYRISEFNSFELWPQFLAHHRETAKCPVDMKPQLFFSADISQSGEIVDCGRINRAGCSNNAEWSITSHLIRFNLLA